MSRFFLRRLQIEGFRGINNEGDPLDLVFKSDAVNSVFGRNAGGKSSVFEALWFAIYGSVPKLKRLPVADHPEEYLRNRFHPGDATIIITLHPDDNSADVIIRVRCGDHGIRQVDSPSGHPDPAAVLDSFRGESVLLDQKTFLNFIDDTPLARGRTFSALLGHSELSEFRQVLEVISNTGTLTRDLGLDSLAAGLSRASASELAIVNTIRDCYRSIFGSEPPTILDPVRLRRDVGSALATVGIVGPFFREADLQAVDFKAVRAAIRQAEDGEKREQLAQLFDVRSELEALVPSHTEVAEREELLAALGAAESAIAGTRGPAFLRLYEVVLEILSLAEWQSGLLCPACESELNVDLQQTTEGQLRRYQQVKEAGEQARAVWRKSQWSSRLKSIETSETWSIELSDRLHARLDDAFRQGMPTIDMVEAACRRIDELDRRRQVWLDDILEKQRRLEAELPPSLVALIEQVFHAEKMADALNRYVELRTGVASLKAKAHARERWQTFISGAATLFAAAETRFSNTRIAALESEYREMYRGITNNPDIVPQLRKNVGSEELFLVLRDFYGLHDLAATALLPESYRNAFALSVFLSAALSSRMSPRFIVLDDITSSFDAGHQFALMELIRSRIAFPSNSNGPQVIILSHDGLLEKYFDSLGSDDSAWHHQRLQGMPPQGVVLTQVQDATRLRQNAAGMLGAGQVDQAQPLVRQYLEYKLLEVIRRLGIGVPLDFAIRDDRKMVGGAIDVITRAVDLHRRAGDLVLDASQRQAIETVHVPALVANWVNHYATGATTAFSPYVLLGVIDTIDRFTDCFKYACVCSGPMRLRYYRTLTGRACGC